MSILKSAFEGKLVVAQKPEDIVDKNIEKEVQLYKNQVMSLEEKTKKINEIKQTTLEEWK